MVRRLDPVPSDVRVSRPTEFNATLRITKNVIFLDEAFSGNNNPVLSVSIDTIAADISTAGYFNADTWASVPADAVVLNDDFRWLGDFNTAAFVVVNVVTPDEQTFAPRKMDPMTSIVEDCVVIHASIIFVWSRACWA